MVSVKIMRVVVVGKIRNIYNDIKDKYKIKLNHIYLLLVINCVVIVNN